MNYLKRVHQNAVDTLLNPYAITSICIHSISAEMVGRANSETIIVLSSLTDLGSDIQVLLGLKYIFEQGAYLLVLDNQNISTAKLVKTDDGRSDITPDVEMFAAKKAIAGELLKYVDNELNVLQLPSDFPIYYWKYELGEMKLADAYARLGLSKPYFYKLCEIYETTIDFYARQWQLSSNLIQSPKKRENNYEKILNLLSPFETQGLTFQALSMLEKELNTCWIDLWRTLLSMKKSRFYYYHLKNNPHLKEKILYQDINASLDVLVNNPTVFIQLNSIQIVRYEAPEERITTFL